MHADYVGSPQAAEVLTEDFLSKARAWMAGRRKRVALTPAGEQQRATFVQALAFDEGMSPQHKIRRLHAVVSRLGTKLESQEERDVFHQIKGAISLLASISAPQETPRVICGYRPDMTRL